MHTVLLVPTVPNHLVEVIFYSIQTGPHGPMKCTSIYISSNNLTSFNAEILHYNIEIFISIIGALGINGEWHGAAEKEKKEEEEGELEDASVRNTSESLPINTLAPPNSTHLYTNRLKNKSDISYLKTSWTFEHSDPLTQAR